MKGWVCVEDKGQLSLCSPVYSLELRPLQAGGGGVEGGVPISPLILCLALFSPAACKESKQPLEVSQRSEEMGLILGICAGGLAVLILLLGAIIIIIRKG